VKRRSTDLSFEPRLSILDFDLQIWKSCKTKSGIEESMDLVGMLCDQKKRNINALVHDVMFALIAVKVPILLFVFVFHEVSPQLRGRTTNSVHTHRVSSSTEIFSKRRKIYSL